MKLTTFRLILGHEKLTPADTPRLRGFFANEFPQFIELHHHIKDNKFLYTYPLVQYKMLNFSPTVIGIEKGVEVIKQIYDRIECLQIGQHRIPITEKQMIQSENDFGIIPQLEFYQFITPWLGLNQQNYKTFQQSTPVEKQELLHRVLIGNLLSMSKSLGYTVPERIFVAANTRLKITRLKGTELSGFTGFFAVNFLIPDYLGLGKSVSRGFGTVRKMTMEEVAEAVSHKS